MIFKYEAIAKDGTKRNGKVESADKDSAAALLQRRGLVVSSIKGGNSILSGDLSMFERISSKDVVMLSRQIATLFGAQVSALRVFALLAEEMEAPKLREAMFDIVSDLEAGTSINKSLARHPKVFSKFYINMVASGEESGRLSETFGYLADYLERNYELTSKAKNALIYPAFVISAFFGVMILMLTYIIPRIGVILTDSGQELPVYTKVVLGASSFLVSYGFIILALIVLGIIALVYVARKPSGRKTLARLSLGTPYLGTLYRKLYLSRLSDNMHTMLASGIPMIRALEVTATVIGNSTYEQILENAIEEVRTGTPLSDSLSKDPKFIPSILPQMIRVGEETGKIGEILETLSSFYKREVNNAVDTLVGLIEPAMIILLGVGVGTLLASVLIPIYNVSTGI